VIAHLANRKKGACKHVSTGVGAQADSSRLNAWGRKDMAVGRRPSLVIAGEERMSTIVMGCEWNAIPWSCRRLKEVLRVQ